MSGENIDEMTQDVLKEMGSGMPEMNADKPFKMPTREELLEMLDTMGLGDEEKEELKAALLSGDPFMPVKQPWTTQAIILMVFLAFLAAVFVLIGYRLYKSMKDKETKKEEKRSKKEEKRYQKEIKRQEKQNKITKKRR